MLTFLLPTLGAVLTYCKPDYKPTEYQRTTSTTPLNTFNPLSITNHKSSTNPYRRSTTTPQSATNRLVPPTLRVIRTIAVLPNLRALCTVIILQSLGVLSTIGDYQPSEYDQPSENRYHILYTLSTIDPRRCSNIRVSINSVPTFLAYLQ
jgi:hypothetical protein